MVTLVSDESRRSAQVVVPSVSIAGIAWPFDKIALVVGAVLAVAGALIVTGSPEIASWSGMIAGLVAFVVTRLHYGAAVTARES